MNTENENAQHTDEEIRATRAFLDAIRSAHEHLRNVHDARKRRGAPVEAMATDEDTLLGLERGYHRSLQRRMRDVGTLLASPLASAVGQ